MHGGAGWYRAPCSTAAAVETPVGPPVLSGPAASALWLHCRGSGPPVLTIAKLGVGQESYYLSKVAQGIEDYYSGKGEVPGVWIGRGAARLGLVGEVAGAELRAVLGGIDPATGQRLAGRASSGYRAGISPSRPPSPSRCCTRSVGTGSRKRSWLRMRRRSRPGSPTSSGTPPCRVAVSTVRSNRCAARVWWWRRSATGRAGRATPSSTPTLWLPTWSNGWTVAAVPCIRR